ncbi:MAG: hypothetical protein OXU75_12365, partial [Deltaproteobacteria bacterium]|nr:hypothetical protein [Deltaproteobacteria bacterium]
MDGDGTSSRLSVSLQWLHTNPSRRAATVHGSPASHPVPRSISSSAYVPFLSVRSINSASTASRRFGNARVALKDIVRLDSDKGVPGMLSRHGRTILFTGDFWNVQHICNSVPWKGTISQRVRIPP